MRPAVALAALLLLGLSLAPPPAAASAGDCMDGEDDDGDGRIDWTDDPGCSTPTDDSERACSVEEPSECQEEVPCAAMLPPGPLSATWTSEGIVLEWEHPLTGPPVTYLIYRAELGETPVGGQGRERVEVRAGGVYDVALPFGKPRPFGVTVRLPEREVSVIVPLSLSSPQVPPSTEPYAAVPGHQTSFLDTDVQADGDYVYWVEGAGQDCRGPMSNAAVVIDSNGFPPPLEDCFYYEPPASWTWPSTDCLDDDYPFIR